MSEVTFTDVLHNGINYPVDTPVEEIKDLSKEQLETLRNIGSVGTPSIPKSAQNELNKAKEEVETLKKQLEEASSSTTKGK